MSRKRRKILKAGYNYVVKVDDGYVGHPDPVRPLLPNQPRHLATIFNLADAEIVARAFDGTVEVIDEP